MPKRNLFFWDADEGAGGGSGSEEEGSVSDSEEEQPPAGDGDEEEDESSDKMVPARELSKTRREAKGYRLKLRAAEERISELEGATKSSEEKLRDQLTVSKDEAKTLREENRALRVQVLGARVGIVESARGDAAQLLDWSSIEDPSDNKDVEKALRALVKEKPYLLGSGTGADGGAGGSRQQESDMNTQIRLAAGRSR